MVVRHVVRDRVVVAGLERVLDARGRRAVRAAVVAVRELEPERDVVVFEKLVIDTCDDHVVLIGRRVQGRILLDQARRPRARRRVRVVAERAGARRRRQRVTRVRDDRDVRVDQRRVVELVVLVRRGEERPVLDDRPAERKAGVDLAKLGAFDAAAVVVPAVGVEGVVTVEHENAPAEAVAPRTRPEIYAAARGTAVFRRKLVRDHLHLGDRLERRLEAVAGRAVVVVVETVDRQIVRVSRAAGKRKVALLERCRARVGPAVLGEAAGRELFFRGAAERQDEVERVAAGVGDLFDLAFGDGAADDRPGRVDNGCVVLGDGHLLLRADVRRGEVEIELQSLPRNGLQVLGLFRAETGRVDADPVNAGFELDYRVPALFV